MFFVLSGYLVMQLLVRDLAGSGSIGYRRFYSRCLRRLVPAAGVVIVVGGSTSPPMRSPTRPAALRWSDSG